MVKEQDRQLLSSLKNGSEASFKTVYEDNRNKFLNYAKRYNLSEEDTVDIYQDAYITFYENISNGKLTELTSSVFTYLVSIGKYKIMEKLRKKKKMVDSESLLEVAHEIDAEVEAFDLEKSELTPEQRILQKHFSKIGEKCQKILTLFYYKQLTINL